MENQLFLDFALLTKKYKDIELCNLLMYFMKEKKEEEKKIINNYFDVFLELGYVTRETNSNILEFLIANT